ncbi:MAG: DNA repair exonuclease [Lactobacillus sp.]|nr:DNA repair exonuclease [Lactobacillus sp.]
MKFIHLADVHLDSPFRGLSFLPSKDFNHLRNSINLSFSRIVDLAIAEDVDLVLIAGDTFDSVTPAIKNQLFFKEQIERLTNKKIQVVMVFGNHDYLKLADSLIEENDYFHLLGLSQSVETLSLTAKDGFPYQVNGFSYRQNHITEAVKFPAKGKLYTFGLAHMQEETGNASHDVYAPFNLENLKSLDYDYFALGHIHLRQVLSQKPWIVYPGNIQGRHIKELDAKGCYLGEIDEKTHETKLTFHKTSPIVWKKLAIELTKEYSLRELESLILSKCVENNTCYTVTLQGSEYLSDSLIEAVTDSNWWRQLSDNLATSYVADVRLALSNKITLDQLNQTAFDKAYYQVTEEAIGQDLAKKSEFLRDLLEDPDFLKDLHEESKLLLAAKLRGGFDEAN